MEGHIYGRYLTDQYLKRSRSSMNALCLMHLDAKNSVLSPNVSEMNILQDIISRPLILSALYQQLLNWQFNELN